MLVLGIDTSCDDTSVGVVEDGARVLSNVVHSQVKLHRPHGGVVPELASREHIKNIMPVAEEALKKAELRLRDLDGIAVTIGPGLIGSLLVGLYYSKAVAYAQGLPLVGINHLEGHILSIFLEDYPPDFPFVALTVSGGHTSIYRVEGYGQYVLMGQTLDDAAGEAFDKVAKILGLGYPGGPVVEDAAVKGVKQKVKFPRSYLWNDSLDFSFSGLKTSVALFVKKWRTDNDKTSTDVSLEDIAASFQEAVVDILVEKLMRAKDKAVVRDIVVGGGVACNKRLREKLTERVQEEKRKINIHFSRPAYCTDNGAMIAVAGYHRLLRGEKLDLDADVKSKYPISNISSLM